MNKYLLILFISAFFNINLALANNQLAEHFKMVGQGKMSWLFIDLYQATLYSETGQYKQASYPQALNITYLKDIDKDHLLSATEKEWKKLPIDKTQHQNWLTQLELIWPDIKKGDQLLFVVKNDGLGNFYHNNQLLGGIQNKQFSNDFLAIWLSKNTSEPVLRHQLLGN